nr:aldose epimerase family protein [Bacteroides rodentium]
MERVITLCNRNGLMARFTNYGARWLAMLVPDRQGNLEDVLLGFDDLTGYKNAREQYYGATIGRVCGRIKNAGFNLGNNYYKLAANDVYGKPIPNHLHGGVEGFHCCCWDASAGINQKGEQMVLFTRLSPDGEEGYPGNLKVSVRYTLTDSDSLEIECRAVTDCLTPINLTNHAFFNLAGVQRYTSVLSHRLRLCSAQLIDCDDSLLPTGKIISLGGTVLDFRNGRTISDALATDYLGIRQQKGFSLAYVLNNVGDCPLAVELYEESSGRKLSIYTNQPLCKYIRGI